jgi:tRNA(Ile)-lysidine synthase
VEATHVDHGLRPNSGREAEHVGAIAAGLGATFRSVRVDVAPGPNLEARARAARYAVLPPDVLTGHTADDQAETVLLHLLRGSATKGLAAMRPGIRRPLLAVRRAETVALCAAAGIEPLDDPSNRDRRFLRNRVRHELLPALSAAAQRDLVPVLCRQAELLREDDDLLELLATELDPTDARALAAAPRPLASRAIRRWLSASHHCGYAPDADSVERVLAVAAGDHRACELPGGMRVSRHGQRLRVSYLPVT